MWAISETPLGKYRREHVIDPLLYRSKKVYWRNFEAGYDAAELEPVGRERRTYVLQEYFVPLDQFQVFGKPDRDPVERTLSIAYFALIDIHQYEKQITEEYHAEWFLLSEIPALIFDHSEMVKLAQRQLRYKAALHPILFQLLPEKFTIPQLQALYEGIYQSKLDDRNFSRKLLSTGLLVKLPEKDKMSSKKGAFYYTLDQSHYQENFESFLNLVPNPDKFF